MSDQATETTQEVTQQPASTQLQLQDLLLCAQIIQLASSRGAFKAEEFTQVGGVFERITGFLKDSGALQSAPADTGEASAVDSSAE